MIIRSLKAKLLAIYLLIFVLFVGVLGGTLTVSYKRNLTSIREEAVINCAKEIASMYSSGELTNVDIENGNTIPVLKTTAKDFDASIQIANADSGIINYDLSRKNVVINPQLQVSNDILETVVENKEVYIHSDYFNKEMGEKVSTVAYPIRRMNDPANAAPWSILIIHSSLTSVTNTYKKIVRTLWIPAIILSIVGFIAFYFLTNRFVKRVQKVNLATKEIARGKFDTRVVFNEKDEITELADGFNKMAESLAISDASKRDFVSNAAHELRSPMTSINGFVEGMLDGTIPEDKYKNYLEIVSSEVKRLTKLVNSMLDLSRIESGREVFNIAEFDLAELLRRVIIRFSQKIENKGILPEINIDEDRIPVLADQDKIERVLQNLIDNAIKFTPKDKRLIISCTRKDKKVIVSVKDEGTGISSEDLKFIWDRFYTVDKAHTGHKSGTGLGLPIVKSIIDQHKQEIKVSSTQGEGTEFVFTLEYAGE